MREIKFRCWCINKNQWERDIVLLTLNGGICQLKDGVHIPCKPETHILMQFTGLKDKNGKEIYEGDIIRFQPKDFDGCLAEDKIIGEVKLIETWCAFVGKEWYRLNLKEPPKTCKVIGNIYENPELMVV